MSYQVTILFGKNPTPSTNTDETVDYYSSNLAEPAKCGQPLARLHLVPEENHSSELENSSYNFIVDQKTDIISPSVELVEKKGEILVCCKNSGFPALINKKIIVRKYLIIDSNINFHTGNLDCSGDVLINGSIMAGFKVKAHNITVNGSIENAEVICQGNLVCHGGIVACNDFPLTCSGSLWAKYIENSTLEIKNNIFISGSSLHNSIKATGNLVLSHDSSILVGGKCEIGHSIYCGIVGAKWATPTDIILGCDPFLKQEFKIHCQRLEAIENEQDSMNIRVEQINTYLQHEEGNTTNKEAHALQEEREILMGKLNFTSHKYKAALKERDQLQNKIDEFKSLSLNPGLHITNHLYSGVSLSIKDAQTRIENETLGITVFHDSDNEIISINQVN